MNSLPVTQPELFSVADHVRATAIALAIALVVWRIALFLVDRFCARRFVSRLIPRVATFSTLAKSVIGIVVVLSLLLVGLHIWSVDVTPAVWSAGIVTASLAFGAQWFVKDVIAGLSVLFEDQFDVDDSVELLTQTNAVIAGRVETVGLRSTRIADDRGRLITLANGNIQSVTNASRMPNRVGLTLTLPWKADAVTMRSRLEAIAKAAAKDAGLAEADVVVYLHEAAADHGSFRIEVTAAGAGRSKAERGFAELVIARVQREGWLPGGAASEAAKQGVPSEASG